MNPTLQTRIKLATLAVALMALAVLIFYQVRMNLFNTSLSNTPVYGSFVNTHGKVLGNPAKTEKDLKLLCKVLSIYRQRHTGDSVVDIMKALQDVQANKTAYNISPEMDIFAEMHNPDSIYRYPNAHNMIPYSIENTRPDGAKVGSSVIAGKRDVIITTNIYYTNNSSNTVHPTKGSSLNPVGFYMIVWDDCQVERIPYYDTFYYKTPDEGGSYTVGFKGQAGLPENAVTYDEMNRKIGFKKQLRGGENKPGMYTDGTYDEGNK